MSKYNEFIKDHGFVNEDGLNALLVKNKTDDSLLFCVYTERFCCTAYNPIEDISHVLEVRLFDETGELKAVRGNIGRDFKWRYISDVDKTKEELEEYTVKEEQYLDVDTKNGKTKGTNYVSIGGGEYEMPAAGYERVVIRHYGDYDEDGMFGLRDFRLVKFLKEKGEK